MSPPLPLATGGLVTRLRAMWLARQTRRLLAEMDDRQLADIGVGRAEAVMEAARPMWSLHDSRR